MYIEGVLTPTSIIIRLPTYIINNTVVVVLQSIPHYKKNVVAMPCIYHKDRLTTTKVVTTYLG